MRHPKPTKRIIDLSNKRGRFQLTNSMLDSEVYIFDAPTYAGSTSQYIEDFVSAVENAGSGTFEIFINQIDEVKCNKLIDNRERINNPEKIVSTTLLSDTKRLLVNTDLSNNEKILFFAFNELEPESDSDTSVKKGTRIYIMESFTRFNNMDGTFSQGEILLNRVHKYNMIKNDGAAVEVNFQTKAVQPSNVKIIKITFDSFAALSGVNIQKAGNITITSQLNSAGWQPNFMYPKTATEAGTVIWENPWVGQMRYFHEFRKQDKAATFAPQDQGKSHIENVRPDSNGNIELILDYPQPVPVTNLIPGAYYQIRYNDYVGGPLGNRFTEFYGGYDSYPNNVDDRKLSTLDIFNNITADNGLSLVGNMSRSFDADRYDGLKPLPDKSPWDDWNGIYSYDFVHLYTMDVAGIVTDDYVLYTETPVPKKEFLEGNDWKIIKEDILNNIPISFNSVNFTSQLPDGKLPQEPDRPSNPKDWSPTTDNNYLLLLPLKDLNFVSELWHLMDEDKVSKNISHNWRYDTSKWMLKTFNGVGKLGKMKIPAGDSEAVNHNRIPQQAFLSKAYCSTNGWPINNTIELELSQEEIINSISLSHYGGEFITLEFLDKNGDQATTIEGNPLPPLRYKSIQFQNRLLTKTKIVYGIT